MLKLDNNLLNELGLGSLPEDQKKAMLQHIYETLELRVGTNLANQMTDQQLEEFEKFIDEGGDANQAQALQWLESNLPNYKQVVNDVFEQLKGEIRQMAPQIMASSSATPNAPVASQPQQSAPMAQPDPNQQYQLPQQPPAYPQQPQAPQGYQQPYAAPQQPMQQPYGNQYAQNQYAQPQVSPQPPTPQQPYAPNQAQPGGYQPAPQGFQPPYPPSATTAPQPGPDAQSGQ